MSAAAGGGLSVKRFERSNRLDTALHKTYLYLILSGVLIYFCILCCQILLLQSCPATTCLVITLIGCNAVGRSSRFFRPLGFYLFFIYFFILYIFFDCKLLYLLCTLPRCTFTTMSIVYLFVSVLLLYVGK